MQRGSKFTIVAALLGVAAAAGFSLHDRQARAQLPDIAGLPGPCRETTFEQADYVVCEIDPAKFGIGIHFATVDGVPYGSLDAFDRASAARGTPAILAMNAGMYHKELSPVGLLIEDGREIAPVATADGEGNFFLKPNGIFLIGADGRAAVMETGRFVATRPDATFATQSGPMLVIDGKLHPRFLPDGTSRFTRNGVGVSDTNTVIFAISLSKVSLGSFARLFRDGLHCPNALFLDGDISSLSNGRTTLLGGQFPVGPILAVRARS